MESTLESRGGVMSQRRTRHFLTFTAACVLLYYLVPLIDRLYPAEVHVSLALLAVGNAVAVLALCAGYSVVTRPAWAFPLLSAVIFIPSVFVHYNNSALGYALYYLLVGGVGSGIGSIIRARRSQRSR